jgi:protein disulfide-isomerase A6
VDAVIDKIPNNVKRVDDKGLESWLVEAKEAPKAILFTDKGKTSALMKAVAIEFKGSISVAQIRDKEKASIELFGITKFPTLLLLPGGKEAAEGIVYDGELKKEDIVAFFSQAATPNPDPAPAKVKLPKSKSSKKASKEEAFNSASVSQASEKGTAAAASATEEVVEEEPTESPDPKVDTQKPIIIPDPAPPIALLRTEEDIRKECLGPRTGTCILALLPDTPGLLASSAVGALSELAHKYKQHKRNVFPFYVVASSSNPGYKTIKDSLDLGADTELIAVNGRRGWWKQLPRADDTLSEKDVTEEALENWIDAIRLGDGAKQRLPDGLIPEEVEESEPTPEETPEPAGETVIAEEPVEETVTVEEVKVDETVAEEKPKATVHGEL